MISPLSGPTTGTSAGPAQTPNAPPAQLVDQFAKAMESQPATDADAEFMRQFRTIFERQIVDQTIRDMQKGTRRLTGKD